MRVLIASDYGTPSAGAEVLLLALREGLRRRGHDVRFLASDARPGGMASLADLRCLGTTSRWRTLLQTANPWAAAALRAALLDFRPDVVHVGLYLTQLSPLILTALGDLPALYHAHWYRAVCPTGTKWLPEGTDCRVSAGIACLRNGCLAPIDWPLRMFQAGMNRRLARRFRSIVATSEAVAVQLRDEGLGPVEVVRPGVPRTHTPADRAAQPTVAFAGRLERVKGAAVLLEAFARVVRALPEARLVIAGDGGEAAHLDCRIHALALQARVERLGFVPHERLADALAGAWVQAVPSLFPEPFGLVAAEAMMRGTAVVASDTGGLREIVRHEDTGLLVQRGDVAALAGALVRVLRDRALAERMGARGRALAEASFDEDAFVDAFVAVYRRLIEEGPLPADLRHAPAPRLTRP